MQEVKYVGHPDRFFIGGKWEAPSSSEVRAVMNSATGEPFAYFAQAQVADIDRAVAAARSAFDDGPWPRLAHAERAALLRALADEIDRLAERNAAVWTLESGVVHGAACSRMRTLGDSYRFYADIAADFPFQERHPAQHTGGVALLVREAVGVVGAIVPWNAPASLTAAKVAPALLAGCTIVLKAAPEAPSSAYLLAEACAAVGMPPGVVNVVVADREASERLVRHPGVDKISFTGSTVAGLRIASICAERMARYTMELGGKSPALVLDDYDPVLAATTIASRAIFMSGQVCSSLTRIIVSRRHQEALVDTLASAFRAVRVGDPFAPGTQMGPLASERQRDRVESYIASGQAEGARLVAGGRRPPHLDKGYFIEPTVFANAGNHLRIAREEIFGPVLSVIPVDSEAEAVQVANDSIYGLNASVFTQDPQRAYSIARKLRCGAVGHNAFRREYNLPSGGFKQSGVGREGGREGLFPYLETKVVILDAMPGEVGSFVDHAGA